jgi:hypothetical protein
LGSPTIPHLKPMTRSAQPLKKWRARISKNPYAEKRAGSVGLAGAIVDILEANDVVLAQVGS